MEISAPDFTLVFEAALEAAYAFGTPKTGDEVVFSRIRIRAKVTRPGNYTVVHPFGTEVRAPSGPHADDDSLIDRAVLTCCRSEHA